MIVVSNTSPFMNLAVVGKLDLLHKLYGKVLIPDTFKYLMNPSCETDTIQRKDESKISISSDPGYQMSLK